MAIRPLVICSVLLALLAGRADAKDYYAERFDSHVTAERDGTIQVAETVLLHFRGGTFTRFSRQISTRRTDGIEFVSAELDGVVLSRGSGRGQIEVTGSSPLRVTWHFEPVSDASHLFVLTYRVRGVVQQEEGADLLAWQILPGEHTYRIDSSQSTFEFPANPVSPPAVDARGAASSSGRVEGRRVYVVARTIGQNGWVAARVRLPRGSLIEAPPRWQVRELRIRGHAANWMFGAGIVFLIGLVLLTGIRLRYEGPPEGAATTSWAGTAPPDPLPPALAGALLGNGRPRLEHAMAALFSLAARGALEIEERPRSFGQHNFDITRRSTGPRPLAEHEQRVLDIVFTGSHGAETAVGFGKARARLSRHFGTFRAAVEREMGAASLFDEDRRSVRARFVWLGIGAFILAAPVALLLATQIGEFGPWPMMIPAALAAVGMVAFIVHAAHTPLSNEAVRRAQYWRAFRKHMQKVARDRESAPVESTVQDWLPLALAIGVAPAWSAYLKRHRAAAPRWFRAAADADRDRSFATFVALVGVGAAGGAHGGGGGAAGGGSSGAS
ncbi:MAG: DUF2207 domain-containing protein [Acidobacteriota bacterium]